MIPHMQLTTEPEFSYRIQIGSELIGQFRVIRH